jgi:galactokinase
MSNANPEAEPLPLMARRAAKVYAEVAGERFGRPRPISVAIGWAPGRINLIGEHTDYSEGFVLPAAIDRQVAIAGHAEDEPVASVYSAHHGEWARFHLDGAAEAETPPAWARYVQATWRQLTLAGAAPPIPGFSASIVGDVPLGAGLSSSAALEVATAMFARALGGVELEPLAVARLCQQAEQTGATVRVGIMDQAASCLGRPQHAILLDCRSLAAEYIAANLPGLAWVVFDTATPHELAASEYNVRRAQCEAAVTRLAPALAAATPGRVIATLRDVTLADLAAHGTLLDETLLRRARHVVTEDERTLRASEALRHGDAVTFGRLMNASHVSLRDDFAVSCPELDAAVEIAQTTPGTLGARMMGGGFGGSIIALVARDALETLFARLAVEYPARTARQGQLIVCALDGLTGARRALDSA